MFMYELDNSVNKCTLLNIPMYDVSMYEGDTDINLLCVINKKQLRNHLRIPLLDVWKIRSRLRFERKILKLYISTNQSDMVDNVRWRVRLLNSLFLDFYSTYKYSHRYNTIVELNKQAIKELYV